MYHLGKVVRVLTDNGKTIIGADRSTQVQVQMWDDNSVLINVHPTLLGQLKEGDVIMARYAQPEPIITKILRGKTGEQVWKDFQEYNKTRKRKAGPHQQVQQVELDVPDDRPQMGPMVR